MRVIVLFLYSARERARGSVRARRGDSSVGDTPLRATIFHAVGLNAIDATHAIKEGLERSMRVVSELAIFWVVEDVMSDEHRAACATPPLQARQSFGAYFTCLRTCWAPVGDTGAMCTSRYNSAPILPANQEASLTSLTSEAALAAAGSLHLSLSYTSCFFLAVSRSIGCK